MTEFNHDIPAVLLDALLRDGVHLIRYPRAIRNLLSDLVPEAELERHAIWISLEAGIPQRLYGVSNRRQKRVLEDQHTRHLQDDWGLREDIARWAVQSWYEVLSDKSIYLPRKPKPATIQIAEAGILRGHTHIITHISFSPSGNFLASSSVDKTAQIWDVSKCTSEYKIENHKESVLCVAFHPKRKEIASASADKTIGIWDQASDNSYRLNGHKSQVNTVAYSPPDGRLFASTSDDKKVKFWQSKERKEVFEWSDNLRSGITDLSFSSDGRLIVVGTRRGDIHVGKIEGLTVRTVKTFKAHSKRISSISVGPERQFASSATDDNTVRLWSLESFEQVGTLEHSGPVNAVAFSPRGSLLATATEDGKIVFWDRNALKSIETIQQDSPVKHIVFDPSGSRLATVSNDTEIQLWSIQYETSDA